jgi:hypothetical protein
LTTYGEEVFAVLVWSSNRAGDSGRDQKTREDDELGEDHGE